MQSNLDATFLGEIVTSQAVLDHRVVLGWENLPQGPEVVSR